MERRVGGGGKEREGRRKRWREVRGGGEKEREKKDGRMEV